MFATILQYLRNVRNGRMNQGREEAHLERNATRNHCEILGHRGNYSLSFSLFPFGSTVRQTAIVSQNATLRRYALAANAICQCY